jgi:16S rRNA C1402 (ribose-2'-O) methylase RsmI
MHHLFRGRETVQRQQGATKKFEENKRGSLREVHDHFAAKAVKGEIVVVIAGTDI